MIIHRLKAASCLLAFGVFASGAVVASRSAAGEKAQQAPSRETATLSELLTAPDDGNAFFMRGAVVNPGRYELTERLTVLDALNYAGGLTGKPLSLQLVRKSPSGSGCPIFLPIDLHEIMKGDVRTNYRIEAGDRICVVNECEVGGGAATSVDLTKRLKEVEWKLEQVVKLLEESKISKK